MSYVTFNGDLERRFFEKLSKLWKAVYPSNITPIGAKLRQRAFRKICKFGLFDAEKKVFGKKFGFVFGFSSFSADFRGARLYLTSKSNSSRFFALDGQIFRSVWRLKLIFQDFSAKQFSAKKMFGQKIFGLICFLKGTSLNTLFELGCKGRWY